MPTIIFALNAVVPLILIIALGYGLKKVNFITKEFAAIGNKMVFKVLLPITLFNNIYSIQSFSSIDWSAVMFAVAGIVAVFALGFVLVPLFVKKKSQRGAIVQCLFRSNYAIIGIPLAQMIAGESGRQVASLLSAFAVPTFNILAVITLSYFQVEKPSGEDGQTNEANQAKNQSALKKTLLGIAKNPLIHGVLLGLVAVGVRSIFIKHGISFRLSNIKFIYDAVEKLANVTTPLALIVLGAQFEFASFKKDLVTVIITSVFRNAIIPAVMLVIAGVFFNFSPAVIASLVAIFASPVAVSSAIMAQEMHADADLARSFVVSTTILSAPMLVIIIAVLRALALV